MGKEWRSLSDAQKDKFYAKAEREQKKYEKAKKKYEESKKKSIKGGANAYMTKMANAKKQNLASFTYTGADKIERTYKRIKVGGLVTYKCVGENCKPKRKKSKKQQRKDLAKAAAKAARTRSKRMSAKKRAAAKAARDKKKHNVGIRQAARKRSARVKREKKAKAKDDREFEYYRKKAQKDLIK